MSRLGVPLFLFIIYGKVTTAFFLDMNEVFENNPTSFMGEEIVGDLVLPGVFRQSVNDSEYLWISAQGDVPVVYYNVSVSDEAFRNVVEEAMEFWSSGTCIQFVDIRNLLYVPDHYLQIARLDGCWSYLGRQPDKQAQFLSLGYKCLKLRTAVHELGHALGFYHTHQRTDRDDFVVVKLDSVDKKRRGAFDKMETNNQDLTYDYESIMHYGPYDFTRSGRETLVCRDPSYDPIIGQNSQPSHLDLYAANKMYQCLDLWARKCNGKLPCLNGGFMDGTCECVCNYGFYGPLCEHGNPEYPLPCGKRLTHTDHINRPTFSELGDWETHCVWYTEKKPGRSVRLTFENFELNEKLYLENLIIKTDDVLAVEGDMYCGSEVPVYSEAYEEVSIRYYSYSDYTMGAGFRIFVNITDNEN